MNKAKMNKAMKKAALAFFLPLLLASADGSGSQDQIGETVYTDGDVSVTRDGSPLSSDEVVIGLPIDNFDFMKTGDDGNAQVKVTTNRAPQSTITVSPDTQFTFELSTLQGRQTSSVNLISGSLSMKVSTLTGDQDLDVQTENTVLGVRGTEFAVTTSDAGDVLVTCSTGDVSSRTENGTEYDAAPGTAVENQAEGQFHTIPVAVSDTETFRASWVEQRRAFVRANAARLIQASAARYRQLRASYDRDYAALMRQRSIIEKWRTEDRRGGMGAAREVERDKRAVGATMMRLRKSQFLLERVYFRLLRLKTLHDQGIGKGTLPGGITTDRFFDQLQRERGDVELRMATVRNVARLYARRNRNEDPTSYTPRFRPEKPLRERRG